jgi:hypothetical protein
VATTTPGLALPYILTRMWRSYTRKLDKQTKTQRHHAEEAGVHAAACNGRCQRKAHGLQSAPRCAHRLMLEVEKLRAEGVEGHAEIARLLTARGVPTPLGSCEWTHTTVARVLAHTRPDVSLTSRGFDLMPADSAGRES